jgi:hypothetical protein
MNLAIEQNWHGKRNWKNADFSAGLRGPSLVSNLNRPTFFSAARRMGRENTERSAVVCGGWENSEQEKKHELCAAHSLER